MKKILPILLIVFVVLSFFNQFVSQRKIPIPADTIIGMYHPFRDLYAKDYPNGIPFKNFLITDPVRQQYPWKKLALVQNKLELPLWNPYSFAGAPLLANFQASFFYPFNLLLLAFPFNFGWGLFIFFQPILAGIFLYLYLSNLKLSKISSFLGAITFAFSGFSIAWLEWGTVVHTALWLPLILLSIDKIFYNSRSKAQSQKLILWSLLFLFSLAFSFFAGHLQTFFYLFLFSSVYFFTRWFQDGKKFNILFVFLLFNILFLILTAIQWFPTLQFILLSNRDVHISQWQNPGWFIPWQNLIQFIAPDFFGNPATLNYWGTWNYAEFVEYIGLIPLIFSLYSLFFRKDKKVIFFGITFFVSLIFAFPTIFAKIPFILEVPFISTSQPTRLLFITDFSLAVLAALGFEFYLRNRKKIFYPIIFISLIFIFLWAFVLFGENLSITKLSNLLVSRQNLIFPTLILLLSLIVFILLKFVRSAKLVLILYICLAGLTVFDLFRFGWKFTPFSSEAYLFPQTKSIEFIQKNIGNSRIMSSDLRILPPNFSVVYKIQSIDGYDPLYLKSYGELISISEGNIPNEKGFGFDRIVAPQNYGSKIIDLLGVKYVLSLTDLSSEKLQKVFQEGETRVYENKDVLPRVFFVKNIKKLDKKDILREMAKDSFNPLETAFIENGFFDERDFLIGKAEISDYKENSVRIKTENHGEGFLIFTDSYYPTWSAAIDGQETEIYRIDYNFRGIIVPQGKHEIIFYTKIF